MFLTVDFSETLRSPVVLLGEARDRLSTNEKLASKGLIYRQSLQDQLINISMSIFKPYHMFPSIYYPFLFVPIAL